MMTEIHLTDDTELATKLTAQTKAALALAAFIGGDTLERVGALLGAVAVLIEREVGAPMAPAALMALVEPMMTDWQAAGRGERPH